MPNNRNRGGPPRHHFTPARESWTRVDGQEFVLFIDNEVKEDEPDSDLPDIWFTAKGRASNLNVILSNLTRQELDVLREFLNRAFDLAEPVVDELDARAAKAWEEGDDSYTRQYRAVPELHVRQQRQPKHDQGVPE